MPTNIKNGNADDIKIGYDAFLINLHISTSRHLNLMTSHTLKHRNM